MPQLPDVAPLGDAPGLSGYELLNWFAMFAPASTSPAILARLAEVMPKIMARPSIIEQLAVQGIVSRSMTDVELRAFVASESDKFAKIIQDASIGELLLNARVAASVKVCGCRPHEGGAARTGAGVRKPPKEETAEDVAG
jgi:hypothetical protein